MIIFKRRRNGETEISIPNWIAALIAVALILAATVILVKYLPIIIHWLQ